MGWVVNVTPRQIYFRDRDPVPIVQKAEWAPEPVWTGAENLIPTKIRHQTVQPLTIRYTDYAIPSQGTDHMKSKKKFGHKLPTLVLCSKIMSSFFLSRDTRRCLT